MAVIRAILKGVTHGLAHEGEPPQFGQEFWMDLLQETVKELV